MNHITLSACLKSARFVGVISIAAVVLVLGAVTASADRGERVDVLIGFTQTPGASEHALVKAFGGDISHSYTIVPAVAASIPAVAMTGLQRHPLITVVEPDITMYAINYTTELTNTWGVAHIGSGALHEDGVLGSGIKVAVIDTGVDCAHSELTCAGGWDFVLNRGRLVDPNGHGTHVAGTIAAARNGSGVVGVAPSVELYSLRVLDSSGSGSISNIIRAIEWAAERGMHITNNSYGSSADPGTLFKQAFDESAARGVLHIGAAGNSGSASGEGDNVGFPARYDSVVAVAATNMNDTRASFSSTGPTVEIAAPGVDIRSTFPNNRYATANGTSMASPHVAGVAALVMSVNPNLTADEVRGILSDTAKNLGDKKHFGSGLVQAIASVAAASDTGSTAPTPSFTYSVEDRTVTFTATTTDNDSISSWVWNFGDGNSSSTQNPVHTYSATGTYKVTLTVTDQAGATSSTSQSVTVTTNEDSGTEPDDSTPPSTEYISVSSIGYTTSGGRHNDRHLTTTLTVTSDLVAISGAVVEFELWHNDVIYNTGSGTTGSDGTVSFTLNNAPSGMYTTVVSGITYSGLTWDEETPTNSFSK